LESGAPGFVPVSSEPAPARTPAWKWIWNLTLAPKAAMTIQELFAQKRSQILAQWTGHLLRSYPAEGQGAFQGGDPFANPVGSTISAGVEALYQSLLGGNDIAEMASRLEPIVRLRAIQGLSASAALAFLPAFKETVWESLAGEIREKRLEAEWVQWVRTFDRLVLRTFDTYVACREKVHEVRLREIERQSVKVWERIQDHYERKGETPLPSTRVNRGTGR
jgi:hypothetical protein